MISQIVSASDLFGVFLATAFLFYHFHRFRYVAASLLYGFMRLTFCFFVVATILLAFKLRHGFQDIYAFVFTKEVGESIKERFYEGLRYYDGFYTKAIEFAKNFAVKTDL